MLTRPELVDRVRAVCISDRVSPDANHVVNILREMNPGITQLDLLVLTEDVLAEFHGLGPLEELLALEGLTDILVNRHDQVWVDQGAGLAPVNVGWDNEVELRNFASRIASASHRRLDESQPFVDLRLPNRARFHAVIPPLAVDGTKISIRIPSPESLSFQDLIALEMVQGQGIEILQNIIANQVSFLISGGTGTGKTTLLAALIGLVPDSQRVLIVEDSSEIVIPDPNVISLQARNANVEGLGEFTMQSLVRQSLRMRPDRLVIGEVRGLEVVDFLNALNTGHCGSATTIHANSAESVPTRIEALGLMAGMPAEAIHAQLSTAIQVVIELKRDIGGMRKVSKISILRIRDGRVCAIPAIHFGNKTVIDSGFQDLLEIVGQ
jgi:pilus assembly protein CpaF